MSYGFPQIAAIRLGYGLSPLMPPPADAEAVLAGVATAGPGPEAMSLDRAREFSAKLESLRKVQHDGEDQRKAYLEYRQQLNELQTRDVQRRLARAVDDGIGFGERLVQFWSDHFTVTSNQADRNALMMAFVDEAIRPHLNGRFEDMFFAAETHPMMLLYLDQSKSRGPNSRFAQRRKGKGVGLNENLAREAMELHSLGPEGPYDQDDVRELAELLTGLTFSTADGFQFNTNFVEPGAEHVLGKTYGGNRRGGLEDIRIALRDIARRPETAQFISRKLAVHFISDDPSDALVDAMATAYRDSRGDLAQVYRVMVTHEDLAANFRAKVRQPFDLLAAGWRALGVTGAAITALSHKEMQRVAMVPLRAMGQPWSGQNGPDGWAEDPGAWVAPHLLAARINWSLRVPSLMVDELPDPRDFLVSALGDTQSQQLAWAVPKAESQAEGVALVLASSDFNRR